MRERNRFPAAALYGLITPVPLPGAAWPLAGGRAGLAGSGRKRRIAGQA